MGTRIVRVRCRVLFLKANRGRGVITNCEWLWLKAFPSSALYCPLGLMSRKRERVQKVKTATFHLRGIKIEEWMWNFWDRPHMNHLSRPRESRGSWCDKFAYSPPMGLVPEWSGVTNTSGPIRKGSFLKMIINMEEQRTCSPLNHVNNPQRSIWARGCTDDGFHFFLTVQLNLFLSVVVWCGLEQNVSTDDQWHVFNDMGNVLSCTYLIRLQFVAPSPNWLCIYWQ